MGFEPLDIALPGSVEPPPAITSDGKKLVEPVIQLTLRQIVEEYSPMFNNVAVKKPDLVRSASEQFHVQPDQLLLLTVALAIRRFIMRVLGGTAAL
ncbi:hypothetical protein EXS70_02940 [Candidatus Peribacteria bacterium]|nr:hypothetical protein [Candidatus Peribacteria bacterium]